MFRPVRASDAAPAAAGPDALTLLIAAAGRTSSPARAATPVDPPDPLPVLSTAVPEPDPLPEPDPVPVPAPEPLPEPPDPPLPVAGVPVPVELEPRTLTGSSARVTGAFSDTGAWVPESRPAVPSVLDDPPVLPLPGVPVVAPLPAEPAALEPRMLSESPAIVAGTLTPTGAWVPERTASVPVVLSPAPLEPLDADPVPVEPLDALAGAVVLLVPRTLIALPSAFTGTDAETGACSPLATPSVPLVVAGALDAVEPDDEAGAELDDEVEVPSTLIELPPTSTGTDAASGT